MNGMNGANFRGGATAPMRREFDPVPENATPRQKGDLAQIKKLSKEYESFFMKEVVSAMRRTVPKSASLDGGNAEEIYKSMLDDTMSMNMAEKGNSGIAQELYHRLSAAYLAAAPKGEKK
ncbi:MAG: rod-binding protein [Nitrospinae bacterium]|nr:rod-binding protein [Nitrospinota bacterium]